MNKQQEIEQLAQAIYKSGVRIDGSDYLFGIDGDDHFTKLAMHLVYGGYGNIEQALTEFVEKLKCRVRLDREYGEYDTRNMNVILGNIDETLEEFKNERTD